MNVDSFYKYECNVYKYQIIYLMIIIGLFIILFILFLLEKKGVL